MASKFKMASKKQSINSDNNNEQSIKVQLGRDSFDKRVGDDLCVEILQWLPLGEKIKLIAVSKQFEECLKLVWKRQKVLKIGRYATNDRNECLKEMSNNSTKFLIFTNILQTFPNITSIVIKDCNYFLNMSQLLDLITVYCDKLESFKSDSSKFSYNSIVNFAQKFGPSIKTLDINGWHNFYMHLVKQCISLKSLRITGKSEVAYEFDGNSYYFLAKGLQKLSISFRNFNSNMSLNEIIKNNKSLTHLDLEFDHSIKAVEISDAFQHISKLKELTCLRIDILDIGSYDQQMATSFQLIANNCTKLKTLHFKVFNPVNRNGFPPEDFFTVFKRFSSLSKINLHLLDQNLVYDDPPEQCMFGIDCIENCKKLTHLTITSYNIPKEFFPLVSSMFHQLRELTICVQDQLTDNEFESMSALKELRTLSISGLFNNLSSITDSGMLSLLNGCNRLNNLWINKWMLISEKSIDSMIKKAKENPGIYFKYSFYMAISEQNYFNIIKSKCLNLNNIEIEIQNNF